MLSATGPPHPPAPAPPESAESADRADPVSSPPGRCPSTRVDLVFANTIIAGQQGTYRHLHTRVTALLADSGLTCPPPPLRGGGPPSALTGLAERRVARL